MQFMRKLAWIAVLVSFEAFAQGPAPADSEAELALRTQLRTTYRVLFLSANYDQIESTARMLREQQLRTPSGSPHLGLFHYEMDSVLFSRELLGFNVVEATIPAADEKLRLYLKNWEARYPQSPLVPIARATVHYKTAFIYRTGKLARDVPAESWGKFDASLKAASLSLNSAPAARADPQWLAVKGPLDFLTGNRAEFPKTLETLASTAPEYVPAWESMLNYLQPKWGGSYDAIEYVADLAARSAEAKGAGRDEYYARIYWLVNNYVALEEIFRDSRISWKRMNTGFEAMHKRFPGSDWNLNKHAQMACAAGDTQTGQRIIRQLGPEKISKTIWGHPSRYQACMDRPAASDGPRPDTPRLIPN